MVWMIPFLSGSWWLSLSHMGWPVALVLFAVGIMLASLAAALWTLQAPPAAPVEAMRTKTGRVGKRYLPRVAYGAAGEGVPLLDGNGDEEEEGGEERTLESWKAVERQLEEEAIESLQGARRRHIAPSAQR